MNGTIRKTPTSTGSFSINIYYNDFFNQVDEDAKDIYKIYYAQNFGSPATSLPETSTPALSIVPGTQPVFSSADKYSTNDILFALRNTSYSSKYGGSLKFHFALCDIPSLNFLSASSAASLASLNNGTTTALSSPFISSILLM